MKLKRTPHDPFRGCGVLLGIKFFLKNKRGHYLSLKA